MAIMRIKELRQSAGLLQIDLAKIMGVLPSAVSNWETELALPRARQLPELAHALNCSIGELFVEQEEEPGEAV